MSADLLLTLGASFGAVVLATIALASGVQSTASRWRERFEADIGGGLRQWFVYLERGRLFRMNLLLLATAAGVALWLTGQPLFALIALLAAGAAPGLLLAWMRRQRLQRLAVQLPDAAMLVSGALRAGSSVPQAIAQAARELPAPAGREFDLVIREQRLGVGIDAAMANLEQRVPLEEVTLFAAAVRIAQETGGNLAETLERLAETLRRKAAIEGKIDALTVQGRLQGWVMALLPLLVGAALFAIEPDAMRPLLTTWQGGLVCVAVLVFEGLGLHFIRRIVSIDV